MESQMILAAIKIFGISEETAMQNYSELQNVPVQLVEHTQLLPGEGKREYDARREQTGVYTGEIKTLVKHLTRLSKAKAEGLLPWEIIFTYYKMVNPDFLSGVEHEETSKVPETQKVEEKVTEQLVAEEVVHAGVVVEETAAIVKEQTSATVEELPHEVKPDTAIDEQAETGAVIDAKLWEPDGEVRVNKQEEQVTAECDTNNLEVHKMETKDLAGLAMGIAEEENLGVDTPDTVETTEKKKGTKPEKVETAVANSITNEFQGSMDERNNFVKANNITLLIASAPSVLERLVTAQNIKGKLAVATGDAAKAATTIATKLDNKLNGLVQKMCGKAGITYDKWAQLSDEEKFARVVKVDSEGNATNAHVEMAKKMVELVVAAKANPAMDVALAAPATKNVNYKGLEIGNVKYPKKEITALLIDKTSNGTLFGAGMLDSEGKPTDAAADKDSLVQVKLSSKKVTRDEDDKIKDNKSGTVMYKPTTVLKGRTALVEKGLVSYLFPNINKEQEGTTALLVLIDGKPASFKYEKVDKDGKVLTVGSGDKVRPAVQTASLKGSGAVYAVIRELPGEYVGTLTDRQAAERWDVKLPAQKNESEFLEDFDNSKIFEFLTIKNMDLKGIGSSTAEKAQAIISAKKQAEAADAEQSFGL